MALVDEFAARGAGQTDNIAADLAGMDAKALNAANDVEVETLVAAQKAQRVSAADDVATYAKSVKEANPWLVINEGTAASDLTTTTKALRTALKDPEGLAKGGANVLKPLRVQANAIKASIDDAEAIVAKLGKTSAKMSEDIGIALRKMPDDAAEVALNARQARRYGDWADVKVKRNAELTVTREQAQKFGEALSSGEILGQGKASLDKLGGLLEQNKALQAKIEGSLVNKSELVSPRLKEIADAKLGLSAAGGPKGAAEQMLSGAVYSGAAGVAYASGVPGAEYLAPFIGAKAAGLVGSKVFGRMGSAATNVAKRASAGVSKFLEIGGKFAPAAPVLATKVLSSVAFGSSREESKPSKSEGKPTRLADVYRKRTDELKAQTTYGPDGIPVMRPEARRAMAARLAPIAAGSPVMADRMETLAARRLEFLAGKVPRRPDLGGMRTGPDRWQPSDMEMRAFARYVAAVEDPAAIVDRLADGSVTPEDAEAMRAVYPEMMADITRQIIEGLPTLRQSLPYSRRLALSVFSGVPVDPSMDPHVLATLQASFTEEPGTEGGSQAPKAAPAFGSVKNQEATPSQARQGV